VLRRVAEFGAAGRQLNQAIARALAAGRLGGDRARRVNRSLMQVESNWLTPEGIPGRPWFKHLLYAARYTYANLELPGLTEAIEKGDWTLAAQQARLLEQAIEKNTALLRATAMELK
jgi:N-acetylated-alpha-linked acidic dipeptidase